MIRNYGGSGVKSTVFLIFVLLTLSLGVQADEKKEEKKQPSGEDLNAMEEVLIDRNKAISEEIDTAAEKLDIMLTGEKVTSTQNKTQVKIENNMYWSEGGNVDVSPHFGVRLRLHNLEEKWQLVFTSYDEEEENRGIDQRQFRRTPKERNYGAGLAFFRQFGKIKTTFQPRLELKDPLEMSYLLKLEPESRAAPSQLHVFPRLEFFAQPDKGVGVFNSYDFIWPLSAYFSLSYLQEFEYEDEENKFTSNNALSVVQRITDRGSFSYSVASTSNNRETMHLEQYGFAVTWYEIAYVDIFEYSIAPTWDFIKENNFKGVAGLRATLNFIF